MVLNNGAGNLVGDVIAIGTDPQNSDLVFDLKWDFALCTIIGVGLLDQTCNTFTTYSTPPASTVSIL